MTNDLVPWLWLAGGVIVCAAEALAPGVFLLWIGLAAIATGLTSFIFPMGGALAVVAFALYAVICVLIGRMAYGTRGIASDRPNLNRRAESLVGRVLTLEDAIVDGAGRARVNDTLWRVRGPDLPSGAHVRVAAVEDGVTLRVEAH